MRLIPLSLLFCAVSFSVTASDLPADPWATRSPVEDRMYNTSEILNVREGTAVRVRQGIGDSAGELDSYKIDRTQYTGEATTFGKAYGQEMIAPEVNKANILLMTEHLRKVGYGIPKEYDSYITNAPAWYQRQYMEALKELESAGGSKSPILKMPHDFKAFIESKTGLSLENFVDTSFKVINGQ